MKKTLLFISLIFLLIGKKSNAQITDSIFVKTNIKHLLYDTLPNGKMLNLDNKEVSFNDFIKSERTFKDKPTLLITWSDKYSEPCIKLIDSLLNKGFQNEYNLVLVNRDQTKRFKEPISNKAYIKQILDRHPAYGKNTIFLLDNNNILNPIDEGTVPGFFFMNPNLNIIASKITHQIKISDITNSFLSFDLLGITEIPQLKSSKTRHLNNDILPYSMIDKFLGVKDITLTTQEKNGIYTFTWVENFTEKTLYKLNFIKDSKGYFVYDKSSLNVPKVENHHNEAEITPATATAKGQNLIPFESKGKIGFKDTTGKVVIEAYYKYSEDFHDGLLLININKKYGFIDVKGKIIIPCIYDYAGYFFEGLSVVSVNDKYGYIDKTGKIIIPCIYNSAGDFSAGPALVCEPSDGKYGYIDKTGKKITPMKYDIGSQFYKGYAAVLLDNSVRIIDLTGKEIKKLKYTKLGWSKEDVTNVGLNDKYGRIYIATGEEIIPPIYDGMPRFNSDFTNPVRLNNKWGKIDKLGNIIIPIRYDQMGATLKNNYRVEINGKYGVMNDSKKLTEVKYDSIGAFEKDFTMVKIGDKFGFIDTLGKELAPITYDYANGFSEGLASIFHKGHWSLLNTKGEELPLFYKETNNYQWVFNFEDGRCAVQFNNKIGLINKKGYTILAPLYDTISDFFDGQANVKNNNKWGVIDTSGNEIIPVEYDEINSSNDDYTKAIKNGKEFYFDKTGKEIKKPSNAK